MTTTVWDAGNILQITQSTDGDRGGTQCVGRAPSRNNNRCGWTIRNQYSEIRDLLRVVSGTQPGLITTETLSQLAKLCLCPDWHWAQKDEVVARWRTVVKAEAQRHRPPVNNNPAPALLQSISQIQITLTQTEQRLAEKETLIVGVRRELDAERILSYKLRQSASETEDRLRLELSDWKRRFEFGQCEKSAQEVTISKIKISNRTLEAELEMLQGKREQDKKELDTERLSLVQLRQNAAETESQLRLELSDWKGRLQSSQDDKKSSDIAISELQLSNDALEKEVKKVLAERVKGEQELATERLSLVQLRQSATESESQLRLELSDWKSRFESSQESTRLQETTISQMQLSNEALEMEKEKLLAERAKEEKELDAFRKRLEEANALLEESNTEKRRACEETRVLQLDLAHIRNEQADAAGDLKKLHVELTASMSLNGELNSKLEGRDESLRQALEDLSRERARIADLETNIARLEISEKELKASISSCWWHGTWMRLAASRKRLSSKRKKDIPPSTEPISHSAATNVLYK